MKSPRLSHRGRATLHAYSFDRPTLSVPFAASTPRLLPPLLLLLLFLLAGLSPAALLLLPLPLFLLLVLLPVLIAHEISLAGTFPLTCSQH